MKDVKTDAVVQIVISFCCLILHTQISLDAPSLVIFMEFFSSSYSSYLFHVKLDDTYTGEQKKIGVTILICGLCLVQALGGRVNFASFLKNACGRSGSE